VAVEKDDGGNILDGHHRAEIAERLGVDYPVVVRTFATEAEKREHVLKLNLARRHLDPVRWGRAFALLMAERGVDTTANHNRHTSRAATVAALAEEIGVSERTARSRVAQARKYDSLPPGERAAVDAGEKTVHKAARAVEKRAKLKAAPAAPGRGKGGWEVRLGDCERRLAEVEAGSVNVVFADPQYNVGVDYGGGSKADRLPDREYLDGCRRWVDGCFRVLAGDGSMWVLIGSEYADHMGIILREAGLHRRGWITWYETFGNCNSAGTNFSRTSRHLFYCVKDPRRFTFHADAVHRPSDRQTEYGDRRADPGGKVWDDVWEVPRLTDTSAERLPDFPTQLPLALVRPIVACSSNPGDLVLDPFCGSATTGVAAVEAGHRFVGIELRKKFVDLARLRLRGVKGR
jgi:site-specific DNA-methyltransferase (adenine-specific)